VKVTYGRIPTQAARLVCRHIKATDRALYRRLLAITRHTIHNERVERCNRRGEQ
jgi:hypothetical protein